MQYPKYIKVKQAPISPEEEERLLAEFKNTKNPKILEKIIIAFSPLIVKSAKKYISYGLPEEELISVGTLALISCVNKFDSNMNYKFATFALSWMKGMMLGFIISNYLPVSIKHQKIKKVFFSLRRILNEEFKKTGDITISEQFMIELQSKFRLKAQDIEMLYSSMKTPVISLSEPAVTTDEYEDAADKQDMLISDDLSPEEILMQKSQSEYRSKIINDAIARLSERDQIIIKEQLYDDDYDNKTLQQLSLQLGVSRERIRQLRETALIQLKKNIIAMNIDNRYVFD